MRETKASPRTQAVAPRPAPTPTGSSESKTDRSENLRDATDWVSCSDIFISHLPEHAGPVGDHVGSPRNSLKSSELGIDSCSRSLSFRVSRIAKQRCIGSRRRDRRQFLASLLLRCHGGFKKRPVKGNGGKRSYQPLLCVFRS